MLSRVFNFEPSSPPLWPSAALGVDSVGVEVPDLSNDAALDDVAEDTDMLCSRNGILRATSRCLQSDLYTEGRGAI